MYSIPQIIDKLGIQDVDPEVQDEILQNLANSVTNRILLSVSEQLPEKDLMEVTILLEDGKEEEAEKMLNSKIHDFDGFKARIEQETIDELAANRQAINDQIDSIKSEKLAI